MDSELTVRYDPTGSILYLDLVAPYAEQDSQEVASGVVGRFNPDTGQLENLEILFLDGRPRWNELFNPEDEFEESRSGDRPTEAATG